MSVVRASKTRAHYASRPPAPGQGSPNGVPVLREDGRLCRLCLEWADHDELDGAGVYHRECRRRYNRQYARDRRAGRRVKEGLVVAQIPTTSVGRAVAEALLRIYESEVHTALTRGEIDEYDSIELLTAPSRRVLAMLAAREGLPAGAVTA